MLFVRHFFVNYMSKISYFYSKQLFVIYFCNSFCVYFYLFGRFKSLIGSSDRIRQLEQKWIFCDWKRQYPKWSFVSDWTQFLSKNSKKGSLNLIEHNFNPNKENQLVKPTHSSWRYPWLLIKSHFIFNLSSVSYPLSKLFLVFTL